MLNKGKLVELKGLVISELPGHYSEVILALPLEIR